MTKLMRWGDPLDGPVGLRFRRENVRNLQDDQEHLIDLLKGIAANQGGKKEKWAASAPAAGPDGQCNSDLVDAIFDFQTFWQAQGKLQTVDGVCEPRGLTTRLIFQAWIGTLFTNDSFKSVPPEGQLDANACWAACYAWWLKATNQTARSQLSILAEGSASHGMVNGDGTVNLDGFMQFLSGRHVGRRVSRIGVTELKGMLTAKRAFLPTIIGFGFPRGGGHVNVIHGYAPDADTVSVMECWFPDPDDDPNYAFMLAAGLPVYYHKRNRSPFHFRGAHLDRNLSYYTSRPYLGTLMIFPDLR